MHSQNPLPPNEIAVWNAIDKLASVILVMMRLQRPTGPAEISTILGIHEQTAKSRLKKLNGLELVTRTHHHNGWMLTNHALQLTMPGMLDDLQTMKFSLFDPINSSKESNTYNLIDESTTTNTNHEIFTVDDLTPDQKIVHDYLISIKIFDPPALELAALEHVTLTMAQICKSHIDHDSKYQTGLAIYNMRNNHVLDPHPDSDLHWCHDCKKNLITEKYRYYCIECDAPETDD